MKKQRLPATSTQVTLTEDMIEATEKFIKRHWQCNQASHKTEFEYILIPPDNKPVLLCKHCVHYPKGRISFEQKDFEALTAFVKEHRCKKGNNAFSFVSTDAGMGTALSLYCMDCGETKDLTDYGTW
jgi:hypothetical protein